jgi:hypothetical protein
MIVSTQSTLPRFYKRGPSIIEIEQILVWSPNFVYHDVIEISIFECIISSQIDVCTFFVPLRVTGHIDLPSFWGNFTIIIKMIILLLFASAPHASLALAGHRSIVTPVQLVVAIGVAVILVVAVMSVLAVIVRACLEDVFWLQGFLL